MNRKLKVLGWIAALALLLVWGEAQAADAPVTNYYYNGKMVTEPAAKLLPAGEKGTLPSLGTARPLFILVDFPDYTRDNLDYDAGSLNMTRKLLNSLRSYFDRASYGRLQLEGEVLGWFTAKHEQSYYEESGGPPEILREALAYFDEQTDYSAFDSDKDGVLDCVALLYVTNRPVVWTSMWFYYVLSNKDMASFDGIRVDKMGFMNVPSIHERDMMMYTITHEMGHFFRLPDYYDADGGMFESEGGMWSPDMMVDCSGDYTAFSKFMLGWMENVYIVTEGTQDLTLRPVSEAGDMAIVFPSYKSPLSEYFVVEYITETRNNVLLGEGIWPIAPKRAHSSGLRILRVNAEETKTGFKYNNTGTEEKLVESVKKGFWEMADPGADLYRLLLFRDGEEFTPNTYPSSYGFAGQFTGVSVSSIRIADDETSASFSAGIIPKTGLLPITFQPVTQVNGMVSLVANTEIRLKGKTLPYLLIGKKKLPLEFMDVHAMAQENRADFLLRKETGLPADAETPCKLVIPKGTFVNRNGVVNTETSFEVSVRFRDPEVEKKELLKTYPGFSVFFPVDGQNVGLLYAEQFNSDVMCLTISNKGKVSKPRTILQLPEMSSISKFLRLADGSFVLKAASPSDQGGVDLRFISSDLQDAGTVRVDIPWCMITPFRDGVLAVGWQETRGRFEVQYAQAGMEQPEIINNDALTALMTTPDLFTGSYIPNTFDIGNGEWFYMSQEKLLKAAIITSEGEVRVSRGWKEEDGDFARAAPYVPGVPIGAVRTGEDRITLFMLEGVATVPNAILCDGSLVAVDLDNDLNVLSRKTVRTYTGLTGADFVYSGQIIRLSNGGYALPLTVNMTPENKNASPIGLVCFLDAQMNFQEEAWIQQTNMGSFATAVELTPGEYFVGCWHSFRFLGK